MNIELIFHGVPEGHDCYSTVEDKEYVKKFYNSSGEGCYMRIEIRNIGSNRYVYYNYLVYSSEKQKVSSNSKRPGSYFGMSLRMDAYCDDFVRLYNILDTVFSRCILGNVMEANGDNLTYRVSSFKQVESELSQATALVTDLFQRSVLSSSIMTLDGFPTASGKLVSANLYDYSRAEFTQLLKTSGAMSISPYFPSRATLEARKEAEQELAKQKNQIAAAQAEISKEREAYVSREQKLRDDLKREHRRAEEALDKAEKFRKENLALKTRASSSANGDGLSSIPHWGLATDPRINRLFTQLLPIGTFILVFILCIIVTMSMFRGCVDKEDSESTNNKVSIIGKGSQIGNKTNIDQGIDYGNGDSSESNGNGAQRKLNDEYPNHFEDLGYPGSEAQYKLKGKYPEDAQMREEIQRLANGLEKKINEATKRYIDKVRKSKSQYFSEQNKQVIDEDYNQYIEELSNQEADFRTKLQQKVYDSSVMPYGVSVH